MAWGSGIWGTGIWGVEESNGGPVGVPIAIDSYDPNPLSNLIDVEYKYNYLITLSRLTGGSVSLNRTDASLGQELEHESASNVTPLRSKDFLESITLSEISKEPDSGNKINLAMPYGDNRHYTHYTVYRTTNILADDSDFAAVENKFLYVDDVPIAKTGWAISYIQEADGNTGIVTFESATMGIDDVGCTIKSFDLSKEFEIIDYIDTVGNNVIFRVTSDVKPVALDIAVMYTIGSNNNAQGGRVVADNGDIVYQTIASTRNFVSSDVGLQLFWSDGKVSFISKVLSSTEVVLEEPDGAPTDFNNLSSFFCTFNPSFRVFNDTIPDETLKSYERRGDPSYFLQTRFFKPLPDGGFGAVKGGSYFVSSVRNSEYYYSQLRDFYRTGSYHPTIQINTKPVGTITRLKEYPEGLCIFGKNFTYYLDTTVEYNGGESRLGEFIVSYADPKLVTNRVGCYGDGSAADVDNGGELIFTNEPAIRYFDGFKYSDNIALNAIQDTKIAEMNIQVSMEWDKKRGLSMWGING